VGTGGYRGATRDTFSGRRMLSTVGARQGPRGVGSCAWPGCPEPWSQVDHVLSRADYPELADDPDNWQGLCASHNASKGRGTIDQARRSHPAGRAIPEHSRKWLR
jgi:5-methylcytosine-specific restriction endonuclease McrA